VKITKKGVKNNGNILFSHKSLIPGILNSIKQFFVAIDILGKKDQVFIGE
jgi:hypothetical protein